MINIIVKPILQEDKKMNYRTKRPEDILPDEQDYFTDQNGNTIRKGTVAAAIANAGIVESNESSGEEKEAALLVIRELAPTLKNFGFNQFLSWKNPQIQKIFDELDEGK